MIHRTLKTTTGKIAINFPTLLSEVTLGQLVKLQEPDLTDVQTISILTNTPIEDLYNVSTFSDFAQFLEYAKSIGHKLSYPEKFPMPKVVHMAGKAYSVPKDIGVEPVGAFMNCQNIIADQINEHLKIYGEDWKKHYKPSMKALSEVLSQYFYTRITGKTYNELNVSEVQDDVNSMPLTEAFPLASFFFLNYPDLLKGKKSFWHSLKIYWHTKLAQQRLRRSSIITR